MPGWEDRRWHYRRSLASRVAVLTTIAVGASIAAMALGAFIMVRMQLQGALDESLLNRADKAAQSTALSELTRNKAPSWMLGAADVRIAYVDLTGPIPDVISADDGPELKLGLPEGEVAAGHRSQSVRTIVAEGGVRYRVATVQAGPNQALVLAQPLESQDKTLRKLGGVMLTFGGLGILAAALAGWGVASNGLRPVRRLTGAVEHIAVTEDLAPLAVEGDDEIARLSIAFNQMLLALAASRDRQKQLVADAGHELRTPLTSLRTNLDLLAQADDSAKDGAHGLSPEARRELLDDVRAQIAELTTLVGDLVTLARDEPSSGTVESVEMAEVVERALARVRRRAPGLTFDVQLAAWPVWGDATALERAVTNLLDNAAKWSPPGDTVTVRLGGGRLSVTDQGPGIAAKDLPHVWERFWRSEESRSMPGSGLGLAIVRQVVEQHGGSVGVESQPGAGSTFWVALPAHRAL
ncbi:two-component sensor histidine kinase [Nocardioides gansuensis]|uniref:histidine kinase n=1 Tax=Nocardioides gansuensis TaxID=2138300 RepID=A0A2T8FEW5_9ACTN|nr:HAMP domain-containing sensor histidine kinase [Nocardioides gansuensis]PVG84254.1 two-component sensor histidine kinase [Nocardioides gansuensis]